MLFLSSLPVDKSANALLVPRACLGLSPICSTFRKNHPGGCITPGQLSTVSNVLHIKQQDWTRATDSPVTHICALGSNLIILDTYEAATELLDKRSRIYSSRPSIPFAGSLMGWNSIFPLMPYGEFHLHSLSLTSTHRLKGTNGTPLAFP